MMLFSHRRCPTRAPSSSRPVCISLHASWACKYQLRKHHRVDHLCSRASPFDWLSSFGKGSSLDKQSNEEEEEATMRRMDGSSEPFGAQAILLTGFASQQEVADFQAMMDAMEASMFRVIPATEAMLRGTLKEALEVPKVPAFEQPPLGTRRTIILSGMYDGEVIEVISAYRDSGQPPAVFAAAVPNNMKRQLADLVTEVHREDAAMRQQTAMLDKNGE